MDQNPTIIETEGKVNKSIEYSTLDASDYQMDFQVKDQFLESFTESREDSSIGHENNLQNDEVLVGPTVYVSTDIQIII